MRKPGEELSLEDIAAWCDCAPSTIQRIEKQALKKAAWSPQNRAVWSAILAAMGKPKTSKKPMTYRPQYGLIVVCEDERDQAKKYDQLRKKGLTVKVVTV